MSIERLQSLIVYLDNPSYEEMKLIADFFVRSERENKYLPLIFYCKLKKDGPLNSNQISTNGNVTIIYSCAYTLSTETEKDYVVFRFTEREMNIYFKFGRWLDRKKFGGDVNKLLLDFMIFSSGNTKNAKRIGDTDSYVTLNTRTDYKSDRYVKIINLPDGMVGLKSFDEVGSEITFMMPVSPIQNSLLDYPSFKSFLTSSKNCCVYIGHVNRERLVTHNEIIAYVMTIFFVYPQVSHIFVNMRIALPDTGLLSFSVGEYKINIYNQYRYVMYDLHLFINKNFNIVESTNPNEILTQESGKVTCYSTLKSSNAVKTPGTVQLYNPDAFIRLSGNIPYVDKFFPDTERNPPSMDPVEFLAGRRLTIAAQNLKEV